jgi:hypothetical protein
MQADRRGRQMATFQVGSVPDNNGAIERQPGFAAVRRDEAVDGESFAPTRMNGGERSEHGRLRLFQFAAPSSRPLSFLLTIGLLADRPSSAPQRTFV